MYFFIDKVPNYALINAYKVISLYLIPYLSKINLMNYMYTRTNIKYSLISYILFVLLVSAPPLDTLHALVRRHAGAGHLRMAH